MEQGSILTTNVSAVKILDTPTKGKYVPYSNLLSIPAAQLLTEILKGELQLYNCILMLCFVSTVDVVTKSIVMHQLLSRDYSHLYVGKSQNWISNMFWSRQESLKTSKPQSSYSHRFLWACSILF